MILVIYRPERGRRSAQVLHTRRQGCWDDWRQGAPSAVFPRNPQERHENANPQARRALPDARGGKCIKTSRAYLISVQLDDWVLDLDLLTLLGRHGAGLLQRRERGVGQGNDTAGNGVTESASRATGARRGRGTCRERRVEGGERRRGDRRRKEGTRGRRRQAAARGGGTLPKRIHLDKQSWIW